MQATNYQSSIGIGCNKSIAKIGSALHKPGSITILAPTGLQQFAEFVKIEGISGLGGKLGDVIKHKFGVETMLDLQNVRHVRLAKTVTFNGNWIGYEKATVILNKAYGLCDDEVVPIKYASTATVSHQFYGKQKKTKNHKYKITGWYKRTG